MRYINTGTNAIAVDCDSIRLAVNKINCNFTEVVRLIGTTSTEIAQDAVYTLFVHLNHVGLPAIYDATDKTIKVLRFGTATQ